MAEHVWKIKTDWAPGWVRETYQGAPIMTGNQFEAEQFLTRGAAQKAIDEFASDRVRMHAMEWVPHSIEVHGERPGRVLGG